MTVNRLAHSTMISGTVEGNVMMKVMKFESKETHVNYKIGKSGYGVPLPMGIDGIAIMRANEEPVDAVIRVLNDNLPGTHALGVKDIEVFDVDNGVSTAFIEFKRTPMI